MENMYEQESQIVPPVAQVTVDALGNTNQDMYNNPFGDFNNQLIKDVSMGKSTEITDLVMQQQPEFCNLTDTMNSFNNNKFNNGGHSDNFLMGEDESRLATHQEEEPSVVVLNDDNNNSNDNFAGPDMGPETDVDAIDDEFQYSAGAAAAVIGSVEKEMIQMELKETEDMTDRSETFDSSVEGFVHSPSQFGNLESKIFEELSLQNPDMMMGNNPFASSDDIEIADQPAEFIDNKLLDEQEHMAEPEMKQEWTEEKFEIHEKLDNVVVTEKFDHIEDENMIQVDDNQINEAADEAEKDLLRANDQEVEVAMQEQTQSDLGIVGTTQAIGESGEEESEDEWNYIKVDKKLEGLTVVEEQSEIVVESPLDSPIVEEKTEKVIEVQAEHHQQLNEFEENLTQSDIPIDTTEQQQPAESILESTIEVEDKSFEKDLQLVIQTENLDEMESQLNPDAKEFVPVSPTRSNGPSSPQLGNGFINPVNSILSVLERDSVVAQSPRKGDILSMEMEDVQVPSENEFDKEADRRPHEVNLIDESNGFAPIESPELLNLKESMQQDDKLEQEYKDDSQFFDEEKQTGEDYKVLESSFDQYSNSFKSNIDDAMNRSFYEGRDGDILAPQPPLEDVLNTVQPIPTFEDDQPESEHQGVVENDKPESDLLSGSIEFSQELKIEAFTLSNGTEAAIPMRFDSFDDFEAEKFVEEVKGGANLQDKYVDSGLSPTTPECNLSSMQTVQETIFVEQQSVEPKQDSLSDTLIFETSTASNIEISEEQQQPEQMEIEQFEMKDIPETSEPTPETVVQESPILPEPEKTEPEVKPELEKSEPEVKLEPKVEEEVIAGAVAVAAVVAAASATVAKKKSTVSKPEAKKTDVAKAKVPAASKTSTVPLKKTMPAARAPLAKPSSAPVKPPISKTTVSATRIAPIARPKPAVTLASTAPIKKPIAGIIPKTTEAPVRPTPAARTTLVKKPATSVAATKPLVKPSTASSTSKPKPAVPAIERKPLASSAPISRATPKPKTNGTSSVAAAAPAKSPTKSTTSRLSTTTTTSRLITTASTPTKSPGTLRVGLSKTAKPDLKSPSVAKSSSVLKSSPAAKSPISAVGTKKPLSLTTVGTKKVTSPTKTTSTVKKTSTTTVVKKSVVNGEVVKQETTTVTQTQAGDGPIIEEVVKTELNGHVNGNGIHDNVNGSGDAVQMVLDSAAD